MVAKRDIRQAMEESERADEEALELERERTRLTRRRASRIAQQAESEEEEGGVVESLKSAFKAIGAIGASLSDIGETLAPGLEGGLRRSGDIAISGITSQVPGLGAASRDVQAGLGAEGIVESFAQRAGQAGVQLSDERIVRLLQRQADLMERGLEQRDRVRANFAEVNPAAAAIGSSLRVWDGVKGFIWG